MLEDNKIQFDLFRLSIRTSKQGSFTAQLSGIGTREDWIRHIFSKAVEFTYYGKTYAYIPSPSSDDGYCYGQIGFQNFELANQPPEQGFKEYISETWRASHVVIDPTDHSDGQKLSIQKIPEGAGTNAITDRLIKALQESVSKPPFLTAIHPITQSEQFWEFAERNRGQITRLTVRLEVPNMFGGDGEYDQEMKDYRDFENAQKVKIELINPEGLNTDSERVAYTVKRAMDDGTGQVTAKAFGKNNTFSSQEKQVSVKVDLDEADDKSISRKIMRLANKVLGRE